MSTQAEPDQHDAIKAMFRNTPLVTRPYFRAQTGNLDSIPWVKITAGLHHLGHRPEVQLLVGLHMRFALRAVPAVLRTQLLWLQKRLHTCTLYSSKDRSPCHNRKTLRLSCKTPAGSSAAASPHLLAHTWLLRASLQHIMVPG